MEIADAVLVVHWCSCAAEEFAGVNQELKVTVAHDSFVFDAPSLARQSFARVRAHLE